MKSLLVYTAIGLSVLLPGLPKRALAQIPSAQTNAGPTGAASNGPDYVAWKGKNTPGEIWYSTSTNNGGTWSSETPISFAKTRQAPALVASGSSVFLAWRGQSTNPTDLVYYSLNTGSGWNSQASVCSVSNCYTTAAPAVALGCGSLVGTCSIPVYMAWVTASGTIEVATYPNDSPGQTWSVLPSAVMANPVPNTAPALAVYDDTIFLAWLEGTAAPYQVYYSSYSLSGSGGPWTSPTPVKGAVSSVPPALGIYQIAAGGTGAKLSAGLYMAWYVPGGVDYADWDEGWGTPVPVPGLPVPPGPLTPALNFTVSIPAGTCGTITTYEFALVYAAPVSGETYDDLYFKELDSNSVLNKVCPKQ